MTELSSTARLAEGLGYQLSEVIQQSEDGTIFVRYFTLTSTATGRSVPGPWAGGFRTLAQVEAYLLAVRGR
jgi:hypothetical protein